MEDQLWNLFRETGEPMGYLLYKAEKREKKPGAAQEGTKPEPAPPPASC